MRYLNSFISYILIIALVTPIVPAGSVTRQEFYVTYPNGAFVYAHPGIKRELEKWVIGQPAIQSTEQPFITFKQRREAFDKILSAQSGIAQGEYVSRLPKLKQGWDELTRIQAGENARIEVRLADALSNIGQDFGELDQADSWALKSTPELQTIDQSIEKLKHEIAQFPGATQSQVLTVIERSERWYRSAKGIAATTPAQELSVTIATQASASLRELKNALSVTAQTGANPDTSLAENTLNQLNQDISNSGFAPTSQGQKTRQDFQTLNHIGVGQDLLLQSMVAASYSQSGSQREELYGAATLAYSAGLAHAQGDEQSSSQLLRGALYALDIGLGFVPVVASINDITQIVYGMMTGKTYTGESFTAGEFGLRALSATLGVIGQSAWVKLGQTFRIGSNFEAGAKALRDAEQSKAISTVLTQAGKETYHALAEFLGELYRKAPKAIDDIAEAIDQKAIKILQNEDGSFSAAKLFELKTELEKTEWGTSYLRKVLKLREGDIYFSNIDETVEAAKIYTTMAKQMLKVEPKTVKDLTVIRMIPKTFTKSTGETVVRTADDVFKPHSGMLKGESRYSLPGNGFTYTVIGEDLKSIQTMAREAKLEETIIPKEIPFDSSTLWPDHIWSKTEVSSHRVLDLTDESTRVTLGITKDNLTGDTCKFSQIVGDVAKRNGFSAMIAPSTKAGVVVNNFISIVGF